MKNQKLEETRAEFDAAMNKTKEMHLYDSCFDYKCKGKYVEPMHEGHILTCNVCGQGIRYPDLKYWINKHISGQYYEIEQAEQIEEYAPVKIKDLKRQIAEQQAEIKKAKADKKAAKAQIKKYRDALEALGNE